MDPQPHRLKLTWLRDICRDCCIQTKVQTRESVDQVMKRFERSPELFGVLLYDGERFVGPLARATIYTQLAKAFQRDLYLYRPIGKFYEYQMTEPVEILSADITLTQAIEQLIERPLARRYDPVVVEFEDGHLCLIDVRDLIGQQCGQLTHAINEVEHQRRQAYWSARHDRLTGLPNRKYALERLESAQISEQERALLFLDFDRFKLINDSLGHDAGDDLLVSIARRMETTLAPYESIELPGDSDICGTPGPCCSIDKPDARITPVRLGGDEFLVIIDPIRDHEEPKRIAEALLRTMGEPHSIKQQTVTSTPSIGVTCSSISGPDPNTLIRDADTAMYHAKSEGRNCYCVFEAAMHAATARKAEVEVALRDALQSRSFELYYQPIIETETGKLKGFESLCRWQHPELGRVTPGEFIPIAEDAGLIDQVGRQCLELATEQLAAWRTQGIAESGQYISVNVSKRQLLVPDMIDHLERIMANADLPRSSICLEITETALSDNRVPVTPILAKLRRLGYRLFIDDFGTGTSSLTSLHDVPADVLKIDRGFILQMQRDLSYSAIVDAVINLARNLKMTVIAEGIEESAQFMQIQALGCDAVQGYLFSEPLPAERATALLTEGKTFAPQDMAA
ncbi:MAG: EAL domain-containing protein [Planctomycetota bacterium]